MSYQTCEDITDPTGNKCFKTITLDNSHHCYCKNEPSTIFKKTLYKNDSICYNCSNKYESPPEIAMADNLNKMKATLNISENIIKEKNEILNKKYLKFKTKLQSYLDIQNLTNHNHHLLSVEKNNLQKLQVKIKSREVDYISIMKQNQSLNTQLQSEINKINQLETYRTQNV